MIQYYFQNLTQRKYKDQ